MGRVLIGLLVIGWLCYNNVVAFQAGYDDCAWGGATKTQCGFEIVGTPRGRLLGWLIYAPGFLLGKQFAPGE